MDEHATTTLDHEVLDVRLPSGRWIALRATEVPGTVGEDDDTGLVKDVKFRSPDFTFAVAILQEVGGLVKQALRPLAPDEAEVEIGIGLSAKTGRVLVVFGEAAAETSLKVTLKWKFGDGGDDGNGGR